MRNNHTSRSILEALTQGMEKIKQSCKDGWERGLWEDMDPRTSARLFTQYNTVTQDSHIYHYLCDYDTYPDRVPVYIKFPELSDGANDYHLYAVVKKGMIEIPDANVDPTIFCKTRKLPYTLIDEKETTKYIITSSDAEKFGKGAHPPFHFFCFAPQTLIEYKIR